MTTVKACFSLLGGVAIGLVGAASTLAAQGPPEPSDAERQVIADRVEALKEKAPEGAALAAYLDCGVQQRTDEGAKVAIERVRGEPYRFPAQGAGAPDTAATVDFDGEEVVYRLAGLDRAGRYLLGLSWWDFDAGARAQTLLVTSPDRRQARIAIPAVGLPNHKVSGEGPAERQLALPVTLAKDGRLQLVVQNVAGPNAVVSELWIWQLPQK